MISTVKIVGSVDNCDAICASAARISTTAGDALEIFERSNGNGDNQGLIRKVLASGHNTILEHAVFNLAFCNVSAFVEQYMIEHRLASFTVKSRRYVDFGSMGYYTPSDIMGARLDAYRSHMEYLFSVYSKLLKLGIPKEDARFVLPYSFCSNFYCTVNARELFYIIDEMKHGKQRENGEIKNIAARLEREIEQIFPFKPDYAGTDCISDNGSCFFDSGAFPDSEKICLIDCPKDSRLILELANSVKMNTPVGGLAAEELTASILESRRPRQLEMLNYTFYIPRLSLSGITHLSRHRIQSLIIPSLRLADSAKYILPASIEQSPEAYELYKDAFQVNSGKKGDFQDYAEYFALSGCMLGVMTQMNARQLHHFFMLRSCQRAQWEIRGVANEMLSLLKKHDAAVFNNMGPSCRVRGICPEGRLSCGRVYDNPV